MWAFSSRNIAPFYDKIVSIRAHGDSKRQAFGMGIADKQADKKVGEIKKERNE